ncbi:MAG: CDP-alcohol phosphatidyltransferase family protein [Spirochaetaceae bacterium]|nr:CDP-alcohol phosphatidyltransferase family protein [Spirochaetaceae bacterium]
MSVTQRKIDRNLSYHGLAVLCITFLSTFTHIFADISSYVLPAWGLVFFVFFYVMEQKHRPLPVADLVTGGRIAVALLFFGFAASGILTLASALALIVLLEAADGFDGWLARKYGPTEFGSLFDMEGDAFIIMLLSYAAVHFTGAPLWVLIPGLLRYVFFFPFLFLKPVGSKFPKMLSWFSKTICVAAVFCLGSVWYLPSASLTAVGIVTVLLAVSFLWETYIYVAVFFQARSR